MPGNRRRPLTPIFSPRKKMGEVSVGNTPVYVPPPPPTVIINQDVGQEDPTTDTFVTFQAVFSEAVTGFTNADVTLGGTAGATTVGVSTSDNITWTVQVSGMTATGTVTATINAAVCTAIATSLPNEASTSSDNLVDFCYPTLSVADIYTSDFYLSTSRAEYDGGYMYLSGDYNPFGTGFIAVVDVSTRSVVGSVVDPLLRTGWNALAKNGDYVYVGTVIGTPPTYFTVVDVSTPSSPTIVGSLSDAFFSSNFLTLAAYGTDYVVAVIATSKIAIIDVTNPAAPSLVGSITDATNLTGNNLSSVVVGDYVYINGSDWTSVYDISNPASPTWVRNVAGSAEFAYEFQPDGDTVWMSGSPGMFAALDVTDPSDPLTVGWVSLPSQFSIGRFAKSGNYAVATGSGRMAVLDLTNRPREMTLLADFTHTNIGGVADVEFDGSWAYCVTTVRFTTVNLTTPSSPVIGASTTTNISGPGRIHKVGNYVYVPNSSGDRLVIFDVTNPAAFTQAGTVTNATTLNLINAAYTVGNYCFLTSSEAGGRFAVVDVSTPSTPTVAASVTGTDYGPATHLVVDGGYAYLASGSNIRVIDVSTPTAPSFVTALDVGGSVASLGVSGTTLLIAQQTLDRIMSIDISTPASPVILDTEYFESANDFSIDGSYMYVREAYTNIGNVRPVDISDPSDLRPIGAITDTGGADGELWTGRVTRSGDTVYLGTGTRGLLTVIDVSDADRPRITAHTGPGDSTYGVGTVGIGVDVSNVYIASDNGAGLYVFDLTPTLVDQAGDTTGGVMLSQRVGDTLYMLARSRLSAVDLSIPGSPSDLFSIYSDAIGSSDPTGLCVDGDYAFVVTRSSDPLLLTFDLTTSPPSLLASNGPFTELEDAGRGGLVADGNYLYHRNTGRFTIFDISTPTAPTVVGAIDDLTNLEDTQDNSCLVIDGNYAYTVADTADRFLVIDISTPSTPTIVGNVQHPTNLNGAASLIKDGNYCYVGCANRFTVVNVSTPSSPTIVRTFSSSNLGNVSGIVISGIYAYCSNGSGSVDRVTVVNISNPTTAFERTSLLDATAFSSAIDIHLLDGLLYVPSASGIWGWLAIVDGACV